MTEVNLNSIGIIVLTAVVSAIFAIFISRYTADRLRKEKKSDERDAKIAELEKQLLLVGASVVPISAAFQAMLIKKLTHFHTPELDALMVKIGPPYRLLHVEYERLIFLLDQTVKSLNGDIDDLERFAAIMLPMVIRMVLAETEDDGYDLKVVKVIPIAGTEK